VKEIKTQDAAGLILAHDITRIIPGEGSRNEVAFAKGHVVREEDIPELLKVGKEHLFVWSDEPGMVHENDAAEALYRLAAGEHMHGTPVREGKIEIIADADGLLRVDRAALAALNASGEVMMATRHDMTPVRKGDKLAGTRAIPLAVPGALLDEVAAAVKTAAGGAGEDHGPAGGRILTLLPYRRMRAGIVNTGSEVYSGLIEDGFTPRVREKMAEYGIEEAGHAVVPDEPEAATAAILKLIATGGADMVFVTGGMSVDPDDRTPLAIAQTGADVVTYGAPVLPGAMFMVAYYGKPDGARVPILGLPGCVMHDRRTIFDIILPRLAAGVEVTGQDIKALAAGGLCVQCETCIFPACGFGAA
jgi:hypothetical protein